jgi:polysaccharide export outer membrane protein
LLAAAENQALGAGGEIMARVVSFSMILAAVAATGCAHHSASAEDEVARISEYKLSLEDVVEVTVWKEPELSRTVPIRPDGKITLPLIGDVKAEGLRPADLEMLVAKQYASLVRDPRVTVIVHDVNGAKVYVTGQVMHSGAFPLRSTMNVLQALAMAGGLAEFANRGDITVLRTDGRRLEVDYDDLVKGKSKVSLGPGDTVVVP